MTARFMIFGMDAYDAAGGMDDLVGHAETYGAAVSFVNALIDAPDKVQIYDLELDEVMEWELSSPGVTDIWFAYHEKQPDPAFHPRDGERYYRLKDEE